MNTLTVNLAKKLIGKKIKWVAPIYEGNEGFYGKGTDGGISKILEIKTQTRNPIVAEIVEGTNMNFIFNEWGAGNNLDQPLCFSDGDRYVTFEIVE